MTPELLVPQWCVFVDFRLVLITVEIYNRLCLLLLLHLTATPSLSTLELRF